MISKIKPKSRNGKKIYTTSLKNLQENIIVISKTRIKAWKAFLILFFIIGFLSALAWAVSIDIIDKIKAGEKITNIAQINYEDEQNNQYSDTASNTLTIITSKDSDNTPPNTINSLKIYDYGSNFFRTKWIAPGDDETVGQASQYDIRYADFKITDANWLTTVPVQGAPVPQPSGSAEYFDFKSENILPKTKYYIGIRASDEVPNWSLVYSTSQKTKSSNDDINNMRIFIKSYKNQFIKSEIPIKFKRYHPIEKILLDDEEFNSDAEGKIEFAPNDMASGQYDLALKVKGFLSKKWANYSVNTTVSTEGIEFSDLLFGDLNDSGNSNDKIDDADWAIMNAKWGTVETEDIDSISADGNQDNIINSLDWALMNKNWDANGDLYE